MRFHGKLKKLLAVSLLAMALLTGVPIDPAKIQELLSLMSQSKVVQTLRQKENNGKPRE